MVSILQNSFHFCGCVIQPKLSTFRLRIYRYSWNQANHFQPKNLRLKWGVKFCLNSGDKHELHAMKQVQGMNELIELYLICIVFVTIASFASIVDLIVQFIVDGDKPWKMHSISHLIQCNNEHCCWKFCFFSSWNAFVFHVSANIHTTTLNTIMYFHLEN